MGDLHALVHRAPGQLKTLAGAITTWMHRPRAEAVRERLAARFGHDLTDARPVPGGDSPEIESTSYVVAQLPDRWRIVERGHIEVCDGVRSWSGTGTLVTESRGEPVPISEAGVLGICLYPGRLVGGLTFGPAEEAEVEGRPCWSVPARPRPLAETRSLAALALSVGRRLSEFVGVEHRFWFDAATGIVLRHEGSVDGELCTTIELTDLVIDAPVARDEFSAPPGAVVRPSDELLRDHLADMGIDPDSVDLDDPDQVRAALRRGSAS
ncbi:MAG TPA: hypothetical protein VIL48_22190 [Acidimicrobiales bacterium]